MQEGMWARRYIPILVLPVLEGAIWEEWVEEEALDLSRGEGLEDLQMRIPGIPAVGIKKRRGGGLGGSIKAILETRGRTCFLMSNF